MPRVVLLSDTHGKHDQLIVPEGDVLLHAGDLSSYGRMGEIHAFDHWLASLPHPHKIIIAGNHDFSFERQSDVARRAIRHATYLQDEAITIRGYKIWGSPWQPWFFDWAFNLERNSEDLRLAWAAIPDDTDILITHGPPHGILDKTFRGELAGCERLRERVSQLQLTLHLFGHIHEAAGVQELNGTWFVNAACLPRLSRKANEPVEPCESGPYVIDLPDRD
ncbi:metallophosphatase domain-containing protein [Tuwongella immobilis]|uniref:Calcineurin-like phosphoesterase domain-containing protein n=1 Tax=Tuwongella immobilis TaxID=692036 RepID=A0A6C2YT10_9BACT|nr:metallophosphatase domain-containing protein [Tuwongella immobilis]VIP04521.1 metallophosphoesterase : 239AB OS=Microscilla marina ATCC 23134 GN=M23134_04270 PE=4 SV=1: Metallophos [Tuwongella immobilis]VTS06404.1 metallophosphoesterase : 239AB OS=Microscilla marina ATCC 23134 GN=M23134_04270 PE=4 SV=1: Metallophos [Tuwongella immobilis]